MKSSLLENKIQKIAELKRDGVYILKFNRQFNGPDGQWLNNYLNGIYNKTGCIFIVLGPEGDILSPVEQQVTFLEDIVSKVIIRHDLLRPAR